MAAFQLFVSAGTRPAFHSSSRSRSTTSSPARELLATPPAAGVHGIGGELLIEIHAAAIRARSFLRAHH